MQTLAFEACPPPHHHRVTSTTVGLWPFPTIVLGANARKIATDPIFGVKKIYTKKFYIQTDSDLITLKSKP
ncbi:MAG TPA: hypothetical protein VKT70_12275 [Stellaceae bacterium]|nr:hypothetical protein [Stellaceae bacterium]